MAALAPTRPPNEFRVETTGRGSPAGHRLRNESSPLGTAVTLREYAAAVGGMLPPLGGSGKVRMPWPPRLGPPKGPASLRVSATRQGVTGTNCAPMAGTPVVKDQIADAVVPPGFRATICQ